jgi:hypothetical protein
MNTKTQNSMRRLGETEILVPSGRRAWFLNLQ